MAATTPSSPRRRLALALVGLLLPSTIIVAALVVVVGALHPGASAPTSNEPVEITEVYWYFTGVAACAPPNSSYLDVGGSELGQLVGFSVELAAQPSAAPCFVTNLIVTTPGFVLTSTNAPLLLHQDTSTSLQADVRLPAQPYTGPIGFLATVATSPGGT